MVDSLRPRGTATSADNTPEATMSPAEPSADDSRDTLAPVLFAKDSAFEAAAWPVLLMDAQGHVLRANSAAADLHGLLPAPLPAPLMQAVGTAIDGRAAQVARLDLAAGATASANVSGRRSFRISALPWRRGTICLLLAQETTLEAEQWAALHAQARRCCSLIDLMRDGFAWESDAEGRLIYISHPDALGVASTDPGDPDPVAQARDPQAARAVFAADAPRHGTEIILADAQGRPRVFRADAAPVHDAGGRWCGARGICRDVTELAEHTAALQRVRHREKLLYDILRITREESGPQAILDTAARGVLPALDAEGAAVYRDTGDGEVLVAHAGTPIPSAAVRHALARLSAGDETVSTADDSADLLALATTHGGRSNGALCLWHAGGLGGWDADERTLAAELAAQIAVANTQLKRESEWRRLSETDSLTGLVNRRAFLAQLAAHLAGPPGPAALLYVDLDNFKLVNDLRGHIAGDDVLKAVARLLRAHTRESDAAARLGGDEFALFLTGITPEAAMRRAAGLAQTAREALADESGDPSRPLSLSVGVAAADPAGRESATELLDRADAAMYRAKRAGKGDVAAADVPG